MATIIELEGYRVETAQKPGRGRNLSKPLVRVVRKSDGAFIDFGHESEWTFRLLWERAAGIPEEVTRAWLQEWIEFHEEGAKAYAGEPYWMPGRAAAMA
jgi:hypothetical protein